MRKFLPAFLAGIALPACAGTVSFGSQVTETRMAEVAAEGIAGIEIRAAAGLLRVTGEPGAAAVRIAGTARAPNQRGLQSVQLTAEQRGNMIHVESRVPRVRSGFLGIGVRRPAALDLEITVPVSVPVIAGNSSGRAEFRATGPLRVRDGSGSLRVQDVLGSLDIIDGSGSIVVRNVAGPVNITDGSGSITVDGVGHDLTIHDGSGSITVMNAGNVRIVSNRSGSISVTDATGSVTVESGGSGRINVHRVGGDFTVRSNRGSIRHEDVRGQVTLPRTRRR